MEQVYSEGVLTQQPRVESKTWTIGTYSMGLTLIGIGVAFAASLWQATTAYELLLWLAPIVFVVLGVELLIVHSPRFLQRYQVRYNWLAVLFVGFVGAGALILAAILSTGLLHEVHGAFNTKDRSVYVDETAAMSSTDVERIVVKTDLHYELHQQAGINEISLLGTLRYRAEKPVQLSEQDLLVTKQVGNVLYVFIQSLEYEENQFTSHGIHSNLILNVPDGVAVE